MSRHDHDRTGHGISHGTEATPSRAHTLPGDEVDALGTEQALSWVSHELKTPISAAMTAVHLANRAFQDRDTTDVQKYLDMVDRQLRRMDDLVTSILDAAQIAHGKLSLRLEAVPVADVLGDVVSSWRDMHPDHEFNVALDGGPSVRGDRERIRQIVENLVSNAVKYGGAARSVALEVASYAATVSVRVRDRGTGIPPEELDRIFDPFHRVPDQGGRGHGVGLFIAAALARLHGGSLTVESEPGAGSTFTLTLPRASPASPRQ